MSPCHAFFGVKALEIGDDDDTARSKRLVGVAACEVYPSRHPIGDPLLSDPFRLIVLWGLKCEGVHRVFCVIMVTD